MFSKVFLNNRCDSEEWWVSHYVFNTVFCNKKVIITFSGVFLVWVFQRSPDLCFPRVPDPENVDVPTSQEDQKEDPAPGSPIPPPIDPRSPQNSPGAIPPPPPICNSQRFKFEIKLFVYRLADFRRPPVVKVP